MSPTSCQLLYPAIVGGTVPSIYWLVNPLTRYPAGWSSPPRSEAIRGPHRLSEARSRYPTPAFRGGAGVEWIWMIRHTSSSLAKLIVCMNSCMELPRDFKRPS